MGKFPTNNDLEHEFYKPPIVSIGDALLSLKFRRIFIKGKIIKVGK